VAGPKIRVTFEINPDSYEMLKDVRDRYGHPNTSKSLRCLLSYAAQDGDWDKIFREVRCAQCG
jgi:hypothetical protein